MVADPTCVFCQIVGGAPARRVWDDGTVVAFLDVRPVFPGHILVVTRDHVESLTDLPGDQVAPFFGAVRHLAGAVEQGMGAGGTFVAVNNRVSQSVPHLHCHVVPRTKGDGLRGFFWPRRRYEDDEEMDRVAAAIADAASDGGGAGGGAA